MTPRSGEYLPTLDGLRGLAVVPLAAAGYGWAACGNLSAGTLILADLGNRFLERPGHRIVQATIEGAAKSILTRTKDIP